MFGGGERLFAVALPLAERVEDDVIGERQHFRHVRRRVSSGESVHFAAEIVAPEFRFVQAARAHAGQVAGNQRRVVVHGEAFQRQQDFCTAFLSHAVQQL